MVKVQKSVLHCFDGNEHKSSSLHIIFDCHSVETSFMVTNSSPCMVSGWAIILDRCYITQVSKKIGSSFLMFIVSFTINLLNIHFKLTK